MVAAMDKGISRQYAVARNYVARRPGEGSLLCRQTASDRVATTWALTMEKDSIPEVLAVSPISLTCPLCKAKPNHDCVPSGAIGVVHVAGESERLRLRTWKKGRAAIMGRVKSDIMPTPLKPCRRRKLSDLTRGLLSESRDRTKWGIHPCDVCGPGGGGSCRSMGHGFPRRTGPR